VKLLDEDVDGAAIAEKLPLRQRMGHGLRSGLASIWRASVDIVTPPLCLGCATPVASAPGLCGACWQELTLLEDPVCDLLGTPFAFDEGEGALSAAALAQGAAWHKARAAVEFGAVSKKLVHQLKYQDRQEAGMAMARLMAAAGPQAFG
jgi:predicted amidophosphoribosyltransferase